MPSRRKLIELDADEIRDYLDAEKTLIIVGNGHNGYPHPMPMWFAHDPDGSIRCTTFGKSQKVLNWRRDPKATLLVESGVEYAELKGVMIYAHCEVIDDLDAVKGHVGGDQFTRARPRRQRKGQATRSSLGHGGEAGRAKVHPESLRHLGPRQAGWSLLTGITYRRPNEWTSPSPTALPEATNPKRSVWLQRSRMFSAKRPSSSRARAASSTSTSTASSSTPSTRPGSSRTRTRSSRKCRRSSNATGRPPKPAPSRRLQKFARTFNPNVRGGCRNVWKLPVWKTESNTSIFIRRSVRLRPQAVAS